MEGHQKESPIAQTHDVDMLFKGMDTVTPLHVIVRFCRICFWATLRTGQLALMFDLLCLLPQLASCTSVPPSHLLAEILEWKPSQHHTLRLLQGQGN